MPQQTPWETLVANALIGTDRQTPQLPTSEGQLQALLSQVPSDPEATLLQSAGILASYQQAGQCPLPNKGQLPDLCPPERVSRCSDQTHQHLQTILSGEYKEVLSELLRLMAQAHQHIPAETLPTLLEKGRGKTELRPSIQAVIGERGRWLARHNSAWAYAAGQILPQTDTGEIDQEAVENLWKTFDHTLRVDLLKTFRSLNPPAAREILATTWKQEKAKDRAIFIAALKTHLSLADEPFLEAALCDRTQDVRTCAGDLLAHLPESQYCQRMTERVQTYIQFEGDTVTIQLPKDDGSWKDEGLEPLSGKLGKRASLLMQIVAAVPLRVWSDDPPSLIEVAHNHQHSAALIQGWTLATQKQANTVWAKALLHYWLQQPEPAALIEAKLIFDLLPAQHIEAQLESWLNRLQPQSAVWRGALQDLTLLGPPPSLEFSQTIWGLLKADIYQQLSHPQQAYQCRSLLQSLALYLHPDLADEVVAYVNTLDIHSLSIYHQDSLMDWRNLLQFRQSIYADFRKG